MNVIFDESINLVMLEIIFLNLHILNYMCILFLLYLYTRINIYYFILTVLGCNATKVTCYTNVVIFLTG